MMERIMIQANPELLDRARRRAAERGVSVSQFVRDAIEHELGPEDAQIPPPTTIIGIGPPDITNLSQLADEGGYQPDPWRS
jgi:hypothetical protein